MDNRFVIENIEAIATVRQFPTVTQWNRLEGRPRAENFERALRAEIRDPLWMLCKQWQMGEFEGDDAGSPCNAKLQMEHARIEKYQAKNHAVKSLGNDMPLEGLVEQRPIPFRIGTQIVSLDLRLLMGRRWLKMLRRYRNQHPTFGDYAVPFTQYFEIAVPDSGDDAQAGVLAHREVWQQFQAVAGRNMDGYEWYARLSRPETAWLEGLSIAAGDANEVVMLARQFKQWFDDQYLQPSGADSDAWTPAHLEYQCACSAPQDGAEKILSAKEYYQGRMDWYNFDVDRSRQVLGNDTLTSNAKLLTRSFLPAPIAFNGMPHTRWWTFEDGKTNFGDIKPDTTDIAKLLLIEFGLVYANDWFMVPYTLPAGSVARIRGLAVTNVFGERYWIEPSGRGSDEQWQRWSMFTLDIEGNRDTQADMSLLLLPTVPKIQEGKPTEEVVLVRDEVANMVWGLETVIPSPTGVGKSGKEAAANTRKYYLGKYPGSSTGSRAESAPAIRYELMTSVPENWIPFIAVQIPEDKSDRDRQVQLQRGSLLRRYPGMPESAIKKIKPLTTLLRPGLDAVPATSYYLNEEEVTRAGIRVFQAYQRTRWRDGQVFTWLGARKMTGRGEGSSGLAFDRVVENK